MCCTWTCWKKNKKNRIQICLFRCYSAEPFHPRKHHAHKKYTTFFITLSDVRFDLRIDLLIPPVRLDHIRLFRDDKTSFKAAQMYKEIVVGNWREFLIFICDPISFALTSSVRTISQVWVFEIQSCLTQIFRRKLNVPVSSKSIIYYFCRKYSLHWCCR